MNPFRTGNYEMKKDQAAKEIFRPHSEPPAIQKMPMTLAGNTALRTARLSEMALGGVKRSRELVTAGHRIKCTAEEEVSRKGIGDL